MIYIIGQEGNRYVKIGYSKDMDGIQARISGMQTGNPHELRLLRVIGGGIDREREIHEKYEAHRVRGEWFKGWDILEDLYREVDFIHGSMIDVAHQLDR